MSVLRRLPLLLLCCFLPSLAAGLQPQRVTLPTLRELTRRSGYIFAGTVVAVRRIGPHTANSVAVVQVTFRVEQPIRGVRVRQLLAIREWSGLWESGVRYHVGERMLLFLYPPSKLGLTSPVGGGLGRFPMDASGQIVLEEARRAALLNDPAFGEGGALSGPSLPLPLQGPAAQAPGIRGKTVPLMSGRGFARIVRRLAVEP